MLNQAEQCDDIILALRKRARRNICLIHSSRQLLIYKFVVSKLDDLDFGMRFITEPAGLPATRSECLRQVPKTEVFGTAVFGAPRQSGRVSDSYRQLHFMEIHHNNHVMTGMSLWARPVGLRLLVSQLSERLCLERGFVCEYFTR